jgi:Glycosyl transferases group 1
VAGARRGDEDVRHGPPTIRRPASGAVACFATKGHGSNEEARILALLRDLDPEVFPFDRTDKPANVAALLRFVRRHRPSLLVMEGTGIAGALGLWLSKWLHGVPYVVSSGDAVGPFLGLRGRATGGVGWLYEHLLYRWSVGFIGWTPYLVGRAFTMGARRGITAANFALGTDVVRDREQLRAELGIPGDALVFGLVGALNWSARYAYCYGAELVRAMRRVRRDDVRVLVVGGGSGLERLRTEAGDDLGHRIVMPGPVAQELVPSYLAAMDVGSLPQSVDQVGALRYTTKLSEYLACGLAVVTTQIPFAYDLDDGWLWRLPGDTPWSEDFVAALADLMRRVRRDEVVARRAAVPRRLVLFDEADQRRRIRGFMEDVLERSRR